MMSPSRCESPSIYLLLHQLTSSPVTSVLLENPEGGAEIRVFNDWKHFGKKWARLIDIWETVSSVLESGFSTKEGGRIAVFARNNKDGEPDTELARQEVERYVLL
jgi:hypothetical protein